MYEVDLLILRPAQIGQYLPLLLQLRLNAQDPHLHSQAGVGVKTCAPQKQVKGHKHTQHTQGTRTHSSHTHPIRANAHLNLHLPALALHNGHLELLPLSLSFGLLVFAEGLGTLWI